MGARAGRAFALRLHRSLRRPDAGCARLAACLALPRLAFLLLTQNRASLALLWYQMPSSSRRTPLWASFTRRLGARRQRLTPTVRSRCAGGREGPGISGACRLPGSAHAASATHDPQHLLPPTAPRHVQALCFADSSCGVLSGPAGAVGATLAAQFRALSFEARVEICTSIFHSRWAGLGGMLQRPQWAAAGFGCKTE